MGKGHSKGKSKLNRSAEEIEENGIHLSMEDYLTTQYQHTDQYVYKYICYIEKKRHIVGLLKIKSQYRKNVSFPYQLRIYDGHSLALIDELYLKNYLNMYADVVDIFFNNELNFLILHLNEFLSIYQAKKDTYVFVQHLQVSKAICQIVDMKPRFIIVKQPLKTRFYHYSKAKHHLVKFHSTEELKELHLQSSRSQRNFYTYLSYRDEEQQRQVLKFQQHHFMSAGEQPVVRTLYSKEFGLTLKQSISKLLINEYCRDRVIVFFMDDISFIVFNMKCKSAKRFGLVRLNIPPAQLQKFNWVGRIYFVNDYNYELGQKKNDTVMDQLCYHHKQFVLYRCFFIQINVNFRASYIDKFLQDKYDEIVSRSSFIT